MKLATKFALAVGFLAGQGWAWVYMDAPPSLAPSAMAAAPQCVTVSQPEVHAKPDLAAILAAMPARIKGQPEQGVDEIAALIEAHR